MQEKVYLQTALRKPSLTESGFIWDTRCVIPERAISKDTCKDQPLSNGRISSDYSKYNDTYLMVTV